MTGPIAVRRWQVIDVLVVTTIVATSVRFGSPGLGLDGLEPALRQGSKLLVIALAGIFAFLHPGLLLRGASSSAFRWLMAFASLALVSVAWSADPARSAIEAATLAGSMAAIALHVANRGWEATRWVLLRSMLAILAVGTAIELVVTDDRSRWTGLNGSATQLAQFAVFAAVLALIGWHRRSEEGIFTCAVVVGAGALIALSQSRMAFVVLLVIFAVLVWQRLTPGTRTPTAVAVASAAASVGFIFHAPIAGLVLRDNVEVAELTTFTGRTSLWPIAATMFEERPVFGWGFASGEQLWDWQVLNAAINWNPSNSHQIALETLHSLGLVGLAILVGVAVTVIRQRHTRNGFASTLLVATVWLLGLTEALVQGATPSLVIIAFAAAGLSLGSAGTTGPSGVSATETRAGAAAR